MMTKIVSKALEYSHGSDRLVGYYCYDGDKAGPRPGIFIVHDAFGVGPSVMRTAERLAELGYAALVVDIWGDGRQLREESEIGPMIGRFASDRAAWMGRVDAGRAALATQAEVEPAKVAGIGYCFGGASVLEYVRTGGDALGVVSFHGGLDLVGREWQVSKTKAKVLVLTGHDDPMAKPAALADLQQAMTSAGINWEVNCYGHAKHAFTNPHADKAGKPELFAYNAQADARSWNAMRSFLTEVTGG